MSTAEKLEQAKAEEKAAHRAHAFASDKVRALKLQLAEETSPFVKGDIIEGEQYGKLERRVVKGWTLEFGTPSLKVSRLKKDGTPSGAPCRPLRYGLSKWKKAGEV